MHYYPSIDPLDVWRFDENGHRKLSLRRLHLLIQRLPPESSTMIALGGPGWTLHDYLLSDIFHATARVPHPSRPIAGEDPIRVKKLEDAKERARTRLEKIANNEIT